MIARTTRFSALTVAVVLLWNGPLTAQPAAGNDPPPVAPLFHLGGFANVELHTSSDKARDGFDLLEMDLFATAAFSKCWVALADVVAERSLKRNLDETRAKVELDLDRLFVAYTRSDALRLEFGETTTGIVRWNQRERRNRFLQTPIDLPAIARRPQNNGAWPLQFLGVTASGRSAGPLGLGYEAGIGTGAGQTRDEFSIGLRSPATLLSLSIAPDAVEGLDIAISGFAQHIPAQAERLREFDTTLSLNYVKSGTEVRAEFAQMNHAVLGSAVRYRTTGYYALFSKRLSGRAEYLRPYLLLDRLNVDPREAYLRDVTPENAWAGGLRYDLSGRFSVKMEYRSQRAPDAQREAILGLQIGISF